MPSESIYMPSLRCSAIRGGIILSALSLIWTPLVFDNEANSTLSILWPMWFWLTFPAGAVVGGRTLERFRQATLAKAVGVSVLIGLATGLVLAAGYWLSANLSDLIGLVKNAHSGGYASYRFSILSHFRAQAVRLASTLLPMAAVTVAGWELTRYFMRKRAVSTNGQADMVPAVRLGIGWANLVVWLILAGFMGALCAVVGTLTGSGPKMSGFVLLVGAATQFLGPWIGPLVGSSWSTGVPTAWALSWAIIPLLGALVPFVLRLRVRHQIGTACWVAYISGLLFWWAAGVVSVLTGMG